MRESGELKQGVEIINHTYCPIILNQMVAFYHLFTCTPLIHSSLMTSSYTELVDIKEITQKMSGEDQC